MCLQYFLTVLSCGDCFILQSVIARISMLKITLCSHVYFFLFVSQFRASVYHNSHTENDRKKKDILAYKNYQHYSGVSHLLGCESAQYITPINLRQQQANWIAEPCGLKWFIQVYKVFLNAQMLNVVKGQTASITIST